MFVNDVLYAIRSSQTNDLRKRYRGVDVLLLDDVQFVEGKVSTAGELAHTIDLLYRTGKQIVLTTDKTPNEMMELNEHLRNLFNSGLVVEINVPDKSMKESLVRAKAKEAGILLRDDVIDYISEICHSNVSEIAGAITNIVALSELSRSVVSLDVAKGVLKTVSSEK